MSSFLLVVAVDTVPSSVITDAGVSRILIRASDTCAVKTSPSSGLG